MEYNYDKWVEDYFEGNLDDKEKEKFDKELKTNPDLQEAYQLQKNLGTLLVDDKLIQLKKTLDDIHKKSVNRSLTIKTFRPWIKWVAAILLIAVIAVWYFYNNSAKKITQPLFYEHFAPYNIAGDSNLYANTKDTLTYNMGLEAYLKGNYKDSYDILDKIKHNNPENFHATFLSGICAIELDYLRVAEESFIHIIRSDIKNLWYHAKWYLSMVYLKKGEIKKVKNSLQDLVDKNTLYKDKALKILSCL